MVDEGALRVYAADPLRYPDLRRLIHEVGGPVPGDGDRVLVVGNPPYVEAKRLPRETSAVLKARYPDAVVGPNPPGRSLAKYIQWPSDEKDGT